MAELKDLRATEVAQLFNRKLQGLGEIALELAARGIELDFIIRDADGQAADSSFEKYRGKFKGKSGAKSDSSGGLLDMLKNMSGQK